MNSDLKEAAYYQKIDENKIKCNLCPHNCVIKEGKRGICKVRVNKKGTLFTENYGMISSIGVDPIEKKPLYHYYPGQKILSIGTYGCNFSCLFCQNYKISQEKPNLKYYSSDQIIDSAIKRDSKGIAYTYSEPMVWYEYVYETAQKAHEANLNNVLVTNGYINKEPLEELIEYIDAVNIDLKSMEEDFYKKICGGTVQPVLDNIKLIYKKAHLEITTLIVTDHNDSINQLERLFKWIAKLSPDIPLHLSRYFPNYKMNQPPTKEETMLDAYQKAKEHLNYVYLGNINIQKGQNTYCPDCGYEVIKRRFYDTNLNLENGRCPKCEKLIIENIK